MRPVRTALEDEVLRWPGVRAKTMFGCPSYQANGILFAFLVSKGVVITRLDDASRSRLSAELHAAPFKAGQRTVRAYLEVPVERGEDIGPVLPFVRKSYEGALEIE